MITQIRYKCVCEILLCVWWWCSLVDCALNVKSLSSNRAFVSVWNEQHMVSEGRCSFKDFITLRLLGCAL